MKLICPLLKLNVPTKNSRIYSDLFVSDIIKGNKIYGEIIPNISNKVDNSKTFGIAFLDHDKDSNIINANIQFYDDKESTNIFDKLTSGKYVLQPKICTNPENFREFDNNILVEKFSIISFSVIPKHLSSQFYDK